MTEDKEKLLSDEEMEQLNEQLKDVFQGRDGEAIVEFSDTYWSPRDLREGHHVAIYREHYRGNKMIYGFDRRDKQNREYLFISDEYHEKILNKLKEIGNIAHLFAELQDLKQEAYLDAEQDRMAKLREDGIAYHHCPYCRRLIYYRPDDPKKCENSDCVQYREMGVTVCEECGYNIYDGEECTSFVCREGE